MKKLVFSAALVVASVGFAKAQKVVKNQAQTEVKGKSANTDAIKKAQMAEDAKAVADQNTQRAKLTDTKTVVREKKARVETKVEESNKARSN